MDRKLHTYHLDDAPDLRSCNLFISSVARSGGTDPGEREHIEPGEVEELLREVSGAKGALHQRAKEAGLRKGTGRGVSNWSRLDEGDVE